MEKLKASKLFEDLFKNSQRAFISEEDNLKNALTKVGNGVKINEFEFALSAIRFNNEFLRLSMIKALISTLIDNDIVEADIDIYDSTITNEIIKKLSLVS